MKKAYTQPQIQIQIVFFESCIAGGSSTINPGRPNQPFNPEIENWDEGGNDSRYWDI